MKFVFFFGASAGEVRRSYGKFIFQIWLHGHLFCDFKFQAFGPSNIINM